MLLSSHLDYPWPNRGQSNVHSLPKKSSPTKSTPGWINPVPYSLLLISQQVTAPQVSLGLLGVIHLSSYPSCLPFQTGTA